MSKQLKYAILAGVAGLGVWLVVVPAYNDWLIIAGAMLVWFSLRWRLE
jgi:hypothetical protein